MKQLLFFSLVFSLATGLFAQAPKVKNLKRFDERIMHYGVSIGFNSAGFALHRKPIKLARDSLASIDVNPQGGFNVGFVFNLKIHRLFRVRFVPLLVLSQRNINFNFINQEGEMVVEERAIESTYLDFPLLLKYRSKRLNNFAAYYVAGLKYSIDLASNQDVRNEEIPESIIKLKRNTTSAEVGIGTDFFLSYFKLGIELKMSYSLQNALIKDNTELSNPLEKIVPKMLFISFLIEG